MGELDFRRFQAMTFDCYGTLIDWEAGLAAALQAVMRAHAADATDEDLLARFARHEAQLEAGPYLRYREVLGRALLGVAGELGIVPRPDEVAGFGGSVADWPAFPDSPAALARLSSRFGLGVITNCDDDLFAASNARLGVTFDWVVTAEQVGSYKPNPRNLEIGLERIGLPRDRVLHVAQSLFHDHVPAKSLGLTTVWIDRRRGRAGFGATPPATAAPDLTLPDLASLAEIAAPG
jgi:2-haloacid dehalogenase